MTLHSFLWFSNYVPRRLLSNSWKSSENAHLFTFSHQERGADFCECHDVHKNLDDSAPRSAILMEAIDRKRTIDPSPWIGLTLLSSNYTLFYSFVKFC